jgi:hypothetical protein
VWSISDYSRSCSYISVNPTLSSESLNKKEIAYKPKIFLLIKDNYKYLNWY